MDTNNNNQSLTEFEVVGLKTPYNFADGHTYHDMPPALHSVIGDLQSIWTEARQTSVFEMEERFKTVLAEIIQSPVLGRHGHYSLFPTASNSIDAVSAWLKSKNYKAGLMEPTFDNLYLPLKRRVDDRRGRLALALEGTGLTMEKDGRATPLPLAWVNCAATGLTDLEGLTALNLVMRRPGKTAG